MFIFQLYFEVPGQCTEGYPTPRAVTLSGTQDISGNNCVSYSAHPKEHFGTSLDEIWGGVQRYPKLLGDYMYRSQEPYANRP